MALAAFRHRYPDFALDPLSSNLRFQPCTDLAVLGTIVVAGPTPESVQVLVPDCTIPPVGNDAVIDLRHVVELSMGTALDMGKELPPPDLASAICPNSLEPTVGLKHRDYWEEVNPLLAEWRSVNNAKSICRTISALATNSLSAIGGVWYLRAPSGLHPS